MSAAMNNETKRCLYCGNPTKRGRQGEHIIPRNRRRVDAERLQGQACLSDLQFWGPVGTGQGAMLPFLSISYSVTGDRRVAFGKRGTLTTSRITCSWKPGRNGRRKKR